MKNALTVMEKELRAISSLKTTTREIGCRVLGPNPGVIPKRGEDCPLTADEREKSSVNKTPGNAKTTAK